MVLLSSSFMDQIKSSFCFNKNSGNLEAYAQQLEQNKGISGKAQVKRVCKSRALVLRTLKRNLKEISISTALNKVPKFILSK